MKILITGINGMLGTALNGVLRDKHDVYGIDIVNPAGGDKSFNVDLTDFELTNKTITKINPDIVIHTVALTDVDKCETNPDLAYRLNAIATRNVAVCCQRFDAALLYISTDYVFSGQPSKGSEEGYTEFDCISPLSIYANSKYEGERYVQNLLNKYYIVRTSWLFGSKRKNFVTQIADALKDGKPANMAEDMVSSPTYVNDLADAISKLIESEKYGLYHLTNSGFASRYDIAIEISKMMGLPAGKIKNVKLKDLNLPAVRPVFSAMKNYVWQLSGFEPMRPWQDAVKEFLITERIL
jgi:dTDP-4-dehydrorhamnose reductase